jgi:hypothetical protein
MSRHEVASLVAPMVPALRKVAGELEERRKSPPPPKVCRRIRQAAVALSVNRLDEDPSIILLSDIRTVFDTLGVDRITSAALIEALLALDSLWHDWRGLHDDRPARKLSQSELARLLRPFDIRPRTIWPVQRQPDAKSGKGYLHDQFEAAWASYCPPAGTPAQSSKVIHLLRS